MWINYGIKEAGVQRRAGEDVGGIVSKNNKIIVIQISIAAKLLSTQVVYKRNTLFNCRVKLPQPSDINRSVL